MQLTAADDLQSLQRTRIHTQKVLILRTIKNSLTGHELRKIEYIRAGIVPCLSELLSTSNELLKHGEISDTQIQEQDALWLQSAAIVAVVAGAGTAFTRPFLKSRIIDFLLGYLLVTNTIKVRLTILRSLNAIASNLPPQSEKDWTPDQSLTRCLYTKSTAECITRIVRNAGTPIVEQQVVEAALGLICKSCTTEKQKTVLVEAGLLDVLCTQLSRFIAMDHFQDDNTLGQGRHSGTSLRRTIHLSPILETIGLLIEKAQLYAERFIRSNEMISTLSLTIDSVYTEGLVRANPAYCPSTRILSMPLPEHLPTKIDVLLPQVMDVEGMKAARKSSFPPLDVAAQPARRRGMSNRTSTDQNTSMANESSTEPVETLVVPWLLFIARSSSRRRRMIAARVLAILKCHGFVHSVRVRSLASLLVPILVDLLDDTHKQATNSPSDTGADALIGCPYSYLVPSTLALTVRDNEHLQKAAVACKAIPKLAAALKSNVETLQDPALHLWWPQKLHVKLTDGEQDSCLGRGGPSIQLRTNMRLREGLLQALASITPDNDNYRKEICDAGALAQIMQALEPFHTQLVRNNEGDSLSVHGNSPQVLVAACGAVRALTRSPTTLRTKLVDADVSKAVLNLLYTSNPEVRISATMVLANLSHDFSPMKQDISEANVVRKLCEQAHSANARLRHESIFALKALVNNSPNKLKKLIIDELGCSWIRHLIATDPHDVPQGEVIGLVQRDYRKGSMARFASDSPDERMEGADSSAGKADGDDIESYNLHTLQQDLDIQAELLAFLRNLTTGESPTEIIDYLIGEIGQEDFMHVLIDRLRDRIQSTPHIIGQMRRSPAVPAATVMNTLYMIAHLAAAERKYRMMLCNNTTLMRQVSTLFGSTDAGVRSACCWLVINLIYPTSSGNGNGINASGDSIDAVMARARELQKLGIMNVVRRLEKTELVVDVRERAATAAECFGRLLERG
ncbi:hypothetical protein H2198_007586 [Neophaeococcomyces mojaviensis]|uniref:Uncharacterized protein n=1 Tax=Neophaeococcomyces mojaviensis TaxID=3383035 RepID=A0ACC3A025_9EURO|nr:hypothetical protein H2198_007586 [Knufia sp. JES_112]